jgi:peptidoglycan/xylan/chitin deacetylase (PgdA/CDA1 family)
MAWYPRAIPDWLSYFFNGLIWHKERDKTVVYITFDDGPTPQVTEFVLDQLDQYAFKATFFCIGDCVLKNPNVFCNVIERGHAVGNHTQDHLNGWKVSQQEYVKNTEQASQHINSKLFRPPYGRITTTQARLLKKHGYQIIMWDVLSGDFDQQRTVDSCLKNLKAKTTNGSIVVFHDSVKAFPILEKVLPEYLSFIKEEGYEAKTL